MAYQAPAQIQTALDAGRISEDAVDLFRAFARRYPFPLDDFQVDAILAILEGSSVIVSAPTGAGKTLVAEFAIHDALMAKRRVAYTTPLKALSNQKYADFCRQFGVAEVGILTGDVKVNPRAPVLVMTTEILRNMFYTGTLEGLRHVVLDECHYMGDEGRGTVWEEIIVNAPKDVTLVALSATVANVREIADWISLVHRPIQAVIHPHRPVPLRYHMADLAAEIHSLDAVRAGRATLGGVTGGGDEGRGRFYARRVAAVSAMLEELDGRSWLPAIYFIFSRAGCERAMDEVLEEGRTLLDRARSREVEQAIADAIEESPTLAASALNQTIFQALRTGVGHSSRGYPAEPQTPHGGAVRARPGSGRLRHRDDEPRHPHAGPQRRSPGAHQAHRPWVPGADDERAHADGGPGRATGHRSGGTVRHRPRRARQLDRGAGGG